MQNQWLFIMLMIACAWRGSYSQSGIENFRYVDDDGKVQEDIPQQQSISTPKSESATIGEKESIVVAPSSSTITSSSSMQSQLTEAPDVTIPVPPEIVEEPEHKTDATATVLAPEIIPEDISPVVADPQKMTREELFQLAFKKPPMPRSHDFMVRLFVDDQDFGDVQVLYDSSFTGFNFYSLAFSRYLDTLLTTESRARTNGKDGHFNSIRMDSLGFAIGLDERNYELKVFVPPQLKQLMITRIGRKAEVRGTLLEPAAFSFYTNFNFIHYNRCTERLYIGSGSSTNSDGDSFGCDREPLTLDIDGAAVYKHWVLEGFGKVTEPQENEDFSAQNARRGDFRLLRELYESSARFSIGDVNGANNPLMQYETVGGVRYEYSPRLFGKDIFQEKYKIRFLLPRPAQVEVQIDGKVVQQLRLPSGSHELSGFSGHRGVNSVQIFMNQEDGTFTALPFEYVLGDSRNLLSGETQFSISGGGRRRSSLLGYDYYFEEPSLNTLVLYGMLPNLTLGGFSQGSSNNILVGGSAAWSLDSLRWFEALAAANYADSTTIGRKLQLSYNTMLDRLSMSLSYFYQTSTFCPFLYPAEIIQNQERFGVLGSVGMGIPGGSVSVNLGVKSNRSLVGEDVYPVSYSYGVGLNQNHYGISFNAVANATMVNRNLDPYVSMSLSYVFGVGNHNFIVMDEAVRRSYYVAPSYTLKVDSMQQGVEGSEPEIIRTEGYSDYEWVNSVMAGWNWSEGGNTIGSQSYSANLAMQDDFSYGRMWGLRLFNRSRGTTSYTLSDYDESRMTVRSHSFNANMGTSFMFADGVWAFGRPVDRGFILAKPQNGLTGSSVHINHSEYYDADFSQSGWLGAAYYNQITNYRPNEIQISLTDVPMGSWLEQDRYYTMGAYKQGYAVRLGSAARVLMRVRLIDETKQPMDYVYVTVGQIDENGNMMEKRATFTSKDGVLQMGNLHPGHKYRIHFGADSYIKDIDVMVPRGSGALFVLPDIQVEHKQLDMSMTKRSQASLGKPQPPAGPAVEKPSSLPLPMQVPTPAAPVNEERPPSIAPPASANY